MTFSLMVAALVATSATFGAFSTEAQAQAAAHSEGSREAPQEVGQGSEGPINDQPAGAGASPSPLSFRSWKGQKIALAQNQFARLNNRMVLFQAGRLSQAELEHQMLQDSLLGAQGVFEPEAQDGGGQLSAEGREPIGVEPSLRLPKGARPKALTSKDLLRSLEMQVQKAKRGVVLAQELNLEDYAIGYLAQFRDQPQAMNAVVESLSREEMAELLRIMARAQSTSAGPNGASATAP